jgi:diguanylate cyclase (GGDEF)-like protein/PAS domain S-box-containing protein
MPGSIAHSDSDPRPGERGSPPLARAPSGPDDDHLTLFEQQTAIVIVECDTLGRVQRWNPAAQQVFGYDANQALGKPLGALVVPEEHQDAFESLWRDALAGHRVEKAMRNTCADGHSIHAYWTLTPLYESRCGVIGVMCAALDATDQRRDAALSQSDKRLRAAQRLARLGYLVWDLNTRQAALSDEACEILGFPAKTLITREGLMSRITNGERPAIEAQIAQAQAVRESEIEFCASFQTVQGAIKILRVVVFNEYAPDHALRSSLVTIQDISGQRADQQALAESQARLDDAQKIARIGDWEWDWNRRTAKLSKEALRLLDRPLGWNPTDRDLIGSLPPDDAPRVTALFDNAIQQRADTVRYEIRLPCKDNKGARDIFTLATLEYNPDGSPARVKAIMQDITELKSYQRQLHELSFFDSLTQLPNRALFIDRFRQALSDAAWHQHCLGVMMLDLDRFKQINDSLGHGVGDELLKQTARRLKEALRDYDTVARLSGDEFAIILPEVRQATDLGVIASKVVKAFADPFTLAGRDVVVTASLGIALYPDDGKEVDALLQYADAALYHAKANGRNSFQFYSKELTQHASERLSLETELRQALQREQLELFYQPKWDLSSGGLVGAEALMRWRHPTRGLVPPDKFIGIAEETGLIVQMGEWALRSACTAASKWNARRATPLKVAVNLSPRQFATAGFVDLVRDIIQQSGCRPEWVELEITESLLLDARANIRSMLEALSATGLTIAIDDFGTGYSALSYLTRFPVQTLKIDRSFVRELPQDHGSAELVKAIISLAGSLHMSLVAEGVETDGQAIHLRNLGCQMAQGFLFAKPLPQAQFEELILQCDGATAPLHPLPAQAA